MATMTPNITGIATGQAMGMGVILTGVGTTWKTGTAPSISISGVAGCSLNTNTGSATWVQDDTHCSVSIITGGTSGTLTITDATSGASCTIGVNAMLGWINPHQLAQSQTNVACKLVGVGTSWPLPEMPAPGVQAGGSLAGSTTRYYQIIAHTAAGTTIGSTATPTGATSFVGALTNGYVTPSTTNYDILTWSAVGGATSYDVLVWSGSAWVLLANTAALTINNTGQVTSAYSVPSSNTSGTNPTLTLSGITGCSTGTMTNIDSTHLSVLLSTGAVAGNLKISDGNTGSATYLCVKVTDTTNPLTILSLNQPTFSSSNYFGNAASLYITQNGNYQWRSAGTALPQWYALDLSAKPSANRQQVLISWRTQNGDADYGIPNFQNDGSSNLPCSYLIESNTAAGGGSPPATGWAAVAQITGRLWSTQQHVVNLAGANWVRVTVLGVRGQALNDDATMWDMNVWDFSGTIAASECVMFLGDSITANSETINGVANGWEWGVPYMGELINGRASTKYPAWVGRGHPFFKASDMLLYSQDWINQFPGKYVCLMLGTNDAAAALPAATYQSNMQSIVNQITGAGKTAIVARIPWGPTVSQGSSTGAACNATIPSLTGITVGPDFWTFYQASPALISGDNVHPSSEGDARMRLIWRDFLLKQLYSITHVENVPAHGMAAGIL